MGCDIHIVLERRKAAGGKWVGVYCTDDLPDRCSAGRPFVAQRDYAFFAEVAHVRGSSDTGLYPKNIPEDVSKLAWQAYMEAPTDHHSPSHLSIKEFTDAWFRANEKNGWRDMSKAPRKDFAAYDLLGISDDLPDDRRYDYRVVFWFDN